MGRPDPLDEVIDAIELQDQRLGLPCFVGCDHHDRFLADRRCHLGWSHRVLRYSDPISRLLVDSGPGSAPDIIEYLPSRGDQRRQLPGCREVNAG